MEILGNFIEGGVVVDYQCFINIKLDFNNF